VKTKVAIAGWLVMMVLLVIVLGMSLAGLLCLPFCFSILLTPICLLGLLVREDYRTCSACGITLG
jgi:archaellum biogenesis protein FlaJ (TadC family)